MLYQKLLAGITPYFINLSKGNAFEIHRHPEIELSYCVKGSYNIFIDQKEYVLKQGDLAVINPLVSHEIGNKFTKDCLFLTVDIGPAFLEEQFMPFIQANQDYNVFSSDDENQHFKELRALFDESAEIISKKHPFYNLALKGNIYKICSGLLNLLTENSKNRQTVFKSLMDIEKIGQAINIIYKHYDKPLSLDYVCSLCGYSKSNFCKTFKAITGESFHSMLNRHRIDVACLKLKERNSSIEEIALSVGFLDSKSFCRVFKQKMGQSAIEYLKNSKENFYANT